MNLHKEWMTNQDLFGDDYEINLQKQMVKNTFDMRRHHSNEGESVQIDNVECQVVIQDHTNPLNEYKEDRKIMCENTISIHRGSIVTEGTDNYLVITDIDTNGVYKTAKMQKTTDFARWKDSTNTTHSVPAIISNKTLYDDGLSEGKQMILESNKRKVQIPNNDETKILFEQQRFIISDKVYYISSIDNDTQPGVKNIIMVQTQEMVGKDDWANGIAWNGDIETSPTILYLAIKGEDSIKMGYEEEYSAVNNTHNYTFSWSLSDIYGKSTTLATIYQNSSTTCTIKSNIDGNLGKIRLKGICNGNNSIVIQKDINIVEFW